MSFATGLKTIVVATDLHGQSEAALEYARKLATHYGARIILAHGTDPLEYVSLGKVPAQVLEGLPEDARNALETMSGELLREGIFSHSEIRQGAVAQMLVDVARQYEAGLIVIGTKGREGAGPLVVGAIAEQLVRLAPCAVMAVAADWNAGPFRPTPGGPVMLAMEQNDATAEAVETAKSLARTFNRPLILVHAAAELATNPCATTAEDYGIEPDEGLTVHCVAKAGSPAEAIAEAIAQYHPCLLVAGVKRTSDTPGPHGTAFALLACSRVPVVCVPPGSVAGRLEPGA
ncbi:MAG: universal stress protein [Terracidiphilus sp.]|nr:universal stress protein [Terracidiphilus sp.]